MSSAYMWMSRMCLALVTGGILTGACAAAPGAYNVGDSAVHAVSQAVPAQAVPAQAVPAQAVPAQAVPAQAVPAQVQTLIHDLQSPDATVRLVAAKRLGKLGAAAKEALPALQKALQDPDVDVRLVAERSIRLIEESNSPPMTNAAVRTLIEKLQSPDELVRLKAAKELGKLGPAAKEALPVLQKLLQDPDEDVRRVAGNAIASIQATSPGTSFNVAGTSWTGSESLAGFGKVTFHFEADGKAIMIDAKSRVGGNWTQSGNQVTVTFQNCVYAGTIQGSTLSGNARYTADADTAWTFSLTLDATPVRPEPTRAAGPSLHGTSSGPGVSVSSVKPLPIRRMKSEPSFRAITAQSPTVDKLVEDLQSPDEIVRLKAAKELGKLGAAARPAIPALQKLLQDPDEDVRRVAGNAISSIQAAVTPEGAGRPITYPELKNMLDSLGYQVKTYPADSGDPRYEVTLVRGNWKFPIIVELSVSRKNVWASCFLTRLPEDAAAHGVEYLRLLQESWRIAPAMFCHEPKYNQLRLQRGLENRDVTASRLREIIEEVASIAEATAPIWRQFLPTPTRPPGRLSTGVMAGMSPPAIARENGRKPYSLEVRSKPNVSPRIGSQARRVP